MTKQSERIPCGFATGNFNHKTRPLQQTIRSLIDGEDGQAMTEYAVIAMAVVVSFLAINGILIPPITAYYEFAARMLSFPFP